MKTANKSWLVLVIFLFMVSNISRARRWVLMLQPMGYKPKFLNSLFSIMIAYFTNLGIPRSGEFIRAGTMSKYENISFEKLMGTIVLDRIIDFISLFIVIGIALVWQRHIFYDYLLENMNLYEKLAFLKSGTAIIAMIVLLALSILVFVKRKTLLNSGIGKKITGLVKGFIDGLLSIKNIQKPWEFLFHSIVIWVMFFLMTYLCFFSFEPTSYLSAGAGLVSFMFGALGMVFPSPGGMGSYHFLVQECLYLYGIPKADGFSYAMIAYVTISLFATAFFGLLSFIMIPIYNRKRK